MKANAQPRNPRTGRDPRTGPNPRTASTLALAFLCLWLVAGGPSSATPQIAPDEPIDLELQAADLSQVLRSFAAIGGAEPRIDPAVAGTVTVDLSAVPYSHALHSICRLHELACHWIQADPPILSVRPAAGGWAGYPENISLSLRQAARDQVLQALRTITGDVIELKGSFAGTVSLESKGVPWTQALLQVCADGGCAVDFSGTPVVVTATAATETRSLVLPAGSPEGALRTVLAAPSLHEHRPELVLEGEAPGHVEAVEAEGNWVQAMDLFCQANDCRWAFEYGEPSILRVVMRDPRVEQAVDFDGLLAAPDLAERLAASLGLELVLSDLADRAAEVRIDRGSSFEAAADALAEAVGGSWRIESGRFHVHVPTRSPGPSLRSAKARLMFEYRDDRGSAEGVLEVDRGRPVHRQPLLVDAEPAAAGPLSWLTLSWIPFSPAQQVVLPSVQTCPPSDDAGAAAATSAATSAGTGAATVGMRGRAVRVGPALVVSNQGAVESEVAGSRGEKVHFRVDGAPDPSWFETAADDSHGSLEPSAFTPHRPRIPCLANDLRLVLQVRSEALGRGYNQVLLAERLGEYFLISAPEKRTHGDSRAAAASDQEKGASTLATSSSALVVVGHTPAGQLRLAHVRPGIDGAPPRVEPLELGPGERTRLAVTIDDRPWTLDLRVEKR